MADYGMKIREIRKKSGLSQAELASKIGSPQTSVSTWEKSSYPPLEFIEKALSVLEPNFPIWKFFVGDAEELDDYLPSYVTGEDLETLRVLNTEVDAEMRVSIKRIFLDILVSHLNTAGIKVDFKKRKK